MEFQNSVTQFFSHWYQDNRETIITPHFSHVMGVIVLTSSVCLCVCACVRPSHSVGRTDGHTDLDFGMEVKWKDI